MSSDVDEAYNAKDKSTQTLLIDNAYRRVVEELEGEFPEGKNDLKDSLKVRFSSWLLNCKLIFKFF